MTSARYWHTATLLPDDTVLIAGGIYCVFPLASVEIFDPVAETFSAAGNFGGTERYNHMATLLSDGTALITGGFSSVFLLTSSEVFDHDGITPLPPPPPPPSGPVARVDLQLIEVKDNQRFLLGTGVSGLPVDVELVSLYAAEAANNQPVSFVDVTGDVQQETNLILGVLEVHVALPAALKKANTFQFVVKHDDGLNEHFGTALVNGGVHANTLAPGQ